MLRGTWWVGARRTFARAGMVAALIAAGCSSADGDEPGSSGAGAPSGGGGTPGSAGTQAGAASAMGGAAGSSGDAAGAPAGTAGAGVGTVAGTGGAASMVAGMAGMSGMSGMAGMAGMAAMEGGSSSVQPPTPHEDLGMGDGHDVVLIGDSWMNLGTVGIQQSVLKASGQPYRAYGVSGTRLLDGAIPGQYAQAKAENPDIKTVIMTGGGNDILQNPLALLDCPTLGETCKSTIDMIGERYVQMAAEMAADGVQDIIVIGYTRNTLLGAAPTDYSYETIGPTCETAPLNCNTVDPDEVAGGLMELRDGIHPTDANYDLLGEYIYDLMVSQGIRR